MGAAIGGALPLAVGVAVSPVPIIAVVLILTSHRARVNGPVFVAGWLAGLAAIGAIALYIDDSAGASSPGATAGWVSWVKAAAGVALLAVAGWQFRPRPKGNAQAALPKWVARVDEIEPMPAAGLGAGLAAFNPKNLLLVVGAAAAIAQTGISGGEQVIAYVVFALVGSIGVGAPVVIYVALGERSAKPLAGLKDWMTQYNAVIMAVLCLLIGVKLIGDAISGLTA